MCKDIFCLICSYNNEEFINNFRRTLYSCTARAVGSEKIGNKSGKLERLEMRIEPGLKNRLDSKARKYGTDKTTLVKLILTSALDQL